MTKPEIDFGNIKAGTTKEEEVYIEPIECIEVYKNLTYFMYIESGDREIEVEGIDYREGEEVGIEKRRIKLRLAPEGEGSYEKEIVIVYHYDGEQECGTERIIEREGYIYAKVIVKMEGVR